MLRALYATACSMRRFATPPDRCGVRLMAPTLGWVLELPVLSAAEALGGSGLAGDHRVVGVCVIEVPVDGFVRRGELILSTALGAGPLGA